MGLNSFGGADAPSTVVADLRMLTTLPNSARDELYALLEPHLGPAVPDAAQQVVTRFCQQHQVTEDQLLPVVRGCRELFRTAAGLDVGSDQLARDLDVLLEGHSEVRDALISCYARALPRIRSANIVALLGEYGAVLDDVRIRMDYVQTTQHEPSSMVPIALMSLRYRDDDQSKHLAVQLPLPLIAKLKAMCDAIIGASRQ